MIFGKERRCLHDKLADTIVTKVVAERRSSGRSSGRAPAKRGRRGRR